MGMFGEKIEEYEILEHLGKGGFAHVYRAKCLRSGCFVAIKMIDKALMTRANMVGRVRQEVTIHSRLKHPAVLELFTFFEDVHYVYLVLELAHNGELAKHFRLGTRGLSERAAADIFKQVVAGVTYLHSHNILHRDLSLNNLLLTKDMRVKIADFGLATQLNTPDEKHVTMCGTPNYISPEVASRECHGLPADVWGLGCMLYTLLVGSPPFHTQHVKSTLNRVINVDYKIPKELSHYAQDLLQHLLCREPSKRISLKGILEHPFLNEPVDIPVNNGRQDSRDSGFQTTLHSTQHNKTRPDDKSAASANADFFKLNRQNSMEQFVNKVDNRPSSFNVLSGLRDAAVVSNENSVCSYGQQQSSTSCNEIHNVATNIASNKIHDLNIDTLKNLQIRDYKENDQSNNKENFPLSASTNVQTKGIGVPPLCADRLPPICHRTRNALLKIEPDSVIVEFIKKKGKDREEVITDVCKISKDGMKVVVHPVDGGNGRPFSSQHEGIYHQPSADEVFTYHNLPQKHWKKYLYAARFVDLVKAKTPKITLYSSKAKCQLMENGTDFEAFFYEGEKVTYTSTEGLKIIDKSLKSHNNPLITQEIKYLSDHFQECLGRCRRVETTLSSIPDECFPLVIGKRPAHYIGRNIKSQQTTPTIDHTPVINIGSFCHGTSVGSTKAPSECNMYSGSTNQLNREYVQRPFRMPLSAKSDNNIYNK